MRKLFVIASIVALGAGSSACASKGFVRNRVGEVNDKVTALGKSVEETQERTSKNEQKIGEVDQKADAANAAAQNAGQAAQDARSAANTAGAKAEEIDKASRRLVYEVVLTEDKSRFASGRAKLTPEAEGELDQLVQQLAQDAKNIYIEIEGHTDSVGSPAINERLGMERAEAVKRYLYEQHNVPLHKMNVISYGETKPVAPNNTKAGRAQNRRVVVKVLA